MLILDYYKCLKDIFGAEGKGKIEKRHEE